MAKKIITENTNLTREELEILAKVPNDVFLFSLFCYVIHPVRGKVRFELYPYQKSVLYQFVKERFNILLKFRQAGITELISMYCLWLAMYHPNKKINIISIKDTTAKKVLKKIKFMYKNLPWYLQTPIINGRAGEFGSASMIEFDNGSFIESIPTSSEAGRSESLSLLVIDEAAIVRWAAQIWAAAFPTLSCSVGSTPVFLRHYEEIKKGYPKPITEQIKLRTLCPKQKGVLDISNLGYYTLTHTGSWKKILWTQNKGKLETWFVKDNRGKKAGYTPKHRLFTTKGWKTVEEIIDQNLNIIQADTKVDQLKLPKQVKAPSKEILKPIEEFPGYFVSNLGKVYSDSPRRGFYELTPRPNKDGYLRVALKKAGVKRETGLTRNQGKGKTFQRSVHLLVAEAFLGPKPNPKSQVDHINNQRDCNHINNLRYISSSDNVKKSFEYNLNATLFGIQGDKLPNLLKRGRILEMAEEGFSYREIAREVYPEYKQAHKFVKRILTERGSRVYISKLQVVKKCQRTIYDIHVEDDNSYISANNYINHNTGGSAIVNSCVTGNTKIITDKGLLRIKDICPKKFGAVDLSLVSNLRVLTHKGEWKRIVASVNKGRLETWKVKTKYGNTLKCTPNHKLYTLNGFMTVKDIIEKGEEVILYKTGISEIETPPSIKWPDKEEWVKVKGYDNYQVSNRGQLKFLRAGKWYLKSLRTNKTGYIRVTLHKDGKSKKITMAELVLTHFTTQTKLSKDEVIDHIDCIPTHNWSTNLRVISRKENTRRASLYSYGLKLGIKIGKGFTDIDSLATVKRGIDSGEIERDGITTFIKNHEVFNSMSLKSARSYISKILSGRRGEQVELSKLTLVKKFKATIYDITVEDHHSYITYNYKKGNKKEFNFINKNTPYGVGNFYHSTWVDAIAGGNPFNPIRLYWQMHPERDENWYKQMASALGPKRTAQEIDGDFLSSGNTVFDLADIKAIEDCLSDYPVIKKRFNGQYRQYLEPQSDKEYFIGADVSTGRASDYSAFTCMDKQGEEQAVFKGRIPIDKYAKLLGDTGQLYNWATIAPESNDIGMAVTTKLQDEGYPKLYYYQKMLKKKGKSRPEVDKSPGWLTTQKNRSVIIENLEQDIREEDVIIKDPFFVQEAYTFIYDGLGRPVAMGKHRANNSAVDIDLEGDVYSDDSIFGKAICNHIRKGKTNIIVQPK